MGDILTSPSSWSLLGLSQTAGRLGEIKPGPVFGKGYRQPGGTFQREKQMPRVWLLSVESREGMPERLAKWRSTLPEVFILIAGLFFQPTDHLRWPCVLKKRYFKLYQLHISVLSPLWECFALQEDLLQLPCFFRTVLILFV